MKAHDMEMVKELVQKMDAMRKGADLFANYKKLLEDGGTVRVEILNRSGNPEYCFVNNLVITAAVIKELNQMTFDALESADDAKRDLIMLLEDTND